MMDNTGLLCCIPLEQSGWRERLKSQYLGDFVRANSGISPNNPDGAWETFAAEASFIHRKLESFAQKGMGVTLHATSSDIEKAARRFENVIVIAHWKNDRVSPFDIPSPHRLWQWMLQADPELERLGLPQKPMSSERLQSILDDLLDQGGCRLTNFPEGAEDTLPVSVLRREALNKIPHTLLAPGNRVETWDAMLTAYQFSDLFGPAFQGTAVMAICHSVMLAEAFRRRHPTAICVCNKETASAGINLAKLDAALSLACTRRLPLTLALIQAGDMIDSLGTRTST
jgi:hypothetical protein